MTKLLDQAVAKARTLPPDLQDEVARLVMMFAGDEQDAIPLTPEEEADLAEADAEVARGEVATNERMRTLWVNHRR